MNLVNSYFDSRQLFFNKLVLEDSEKAKSILYNLTRETSVYTGTAQSLLNFGSALCSYNSSVRLAVREFVAIETSYRGLIKKIRSRHSDLEHKEVTGLIYMVMKFLGYQERGMALIALIDLLDKVPGSFPRNLPDFDKTLQIIYNLAYLGVFFSPQNNSFVTLLKISKVAYFVLNEYSECSLSLDQIQDTIKNPTLNSGINLLTRAVHLYGNSLQLYTAGNDFFK